MGKVIITSIFLGIGLAMDACAVSMANGLNEPKMKLNKIILIALMFGLFQGAMPFIGYLVGSVCLSQIEWIIPWVALILLGFIGGKMVFEGFKHDDEKEDDDIIVEGEPEIAEEDDERTLFEEGYAEDDEEF